MKKLMLLLCVCAAVIPQAAAQNAAANIAAGRAFLAARDYASASNSFRQAVVLAPSDETANVLLGLTRVTLLPQHPAAKFVLDKLGFQSTNRLVHHWNARLARDTNGLPMAPPDTSPQMLFDTIRSQWLPEAISAEANLARVTSTNFQLRLTRTETGTRALIVDYSDIQILRSILWGTEYLAYVLDANNLNIQLTDLKALYQDGRFDAETLQTRYPSLLTFANTNDLAAARIAFTIGVALYQKGSDAFRLRTDRSLPLHLFNIYDSDGHAEASFRTTLAELAQSLNRVTQLSQVPNISIDMGAQIAGRAHFRSVFPRFIGNDFVLGSLADPTFGGLVTGISAADVEGEFLKYVRGIPRITSATPEAGQFVAGVQTARTRGYLVQSSTNLVDWLDAGAFVARDSPFPFVDPMIGRKFFRILDRTDNMPRPPNDTMAGAIVLPSAVGVRAYGYNSGARSDSNGRGLVWWRWTPPLAEEVSLTADEGFVYFTLRNSNGSQIASGYNALTFRAEAGLTYFIGAENVFGGGPGLVSFTVAPPLSITWQSPAPLSGQARVRPGTNLVLAAAAAQPGGSIVRLELFIDDALVQRLENRSSLNYSWTNIPPGRHRVEIAAQGVAAAAVSSIFVLAGPPNDAFADRAVIAGLPYEGNWNFAGASPEGNPVPSLRVDASTGSWNFAGASPEGLPPFFLASDIWWSWTAPASGDVTMELLGVVEGGAYGLQVYTGSAWTALLPTSTSALPPLPDTQGRLLLRAVAGTTYQILGIASSSGGLARLRIVPGSPPTLEAAATPSPNPPPVAPASLSIAGSARSAQGSITNVILVADGRLIDTVAAPDFQYSWTGLAAGQHVFTVRAQNSAGLSAETNLVIFVQSPPAPAPRNDNFANRAILTGYPFESVWTLAGATSETGEPSLEPSIWWSWTAPKTEEVRIQARALSGGSQPALYVFTGSSLETLVPERGIGGAEVILNAVAGATYQIAISRLFGSLGEVSLSFLPGSPPQALLTLESDSQLPTGAFVTPGTIQIGVLSSDSDGTVTNVLLFDGDRLLAILPSGQARFDLVNPLAGFYNFKAVAIDDRGLSSTAYSSYVKVVHAPVNGLVAGHEIIFTPSIGPSGIKLAENGSLTASTGSGAYTFSPLFPGASGYAGKVGSLRFSITGASYEAMLAFTSETEGNFSFADSLFNLEPVPIGQFRLAPLNGNDNNGAGTNNNNGGQSDTIPVSLVGKQVQLSSSYGGEFLKLITATDFIGEIGNGTYTYGLSGNVGTWNLNFTSPAYHAGEFYNLILTYTSPNAGTFSGNQHFEGSNHAVTGTFTLAPM